jgi:hypothetical protein
MSLRVYYATRQGAGARASVSGGGCADQPVRAGEPRMSINPVQGFLQAPAAI